MSEPTIRSLPRHVVDVIAAGEVVERPASVVKELVENALDAGATRVDVIVEDGGKRLIRVEDDGRGMGAEDLALAFAPHATSKIRDIADLEAVATCGFRGEALASIGAVAEAVITTRQAGEEAALRVENRRGEVGPVTPAAGPVGTCIEVRSLFAAIPARRKFLRAAATETTRITDSLGRIALARPDVGFSLTVEGRPTLRAPAGETLRERTARVLGADGAAGLLAVDDMTGNVSVSGFLAPPDDAVRGRPPQILSVNGRTVQDRTVSHAVRAALEGLVTIHRSPSWSLAVNLPPGDVDVNVHPAKSEVRFRRPSDVHAAVRHAVRAAILAGESVPSIPGDALERRDGIRDALEAYLGGVASRESQPDLAFSAHRDTEGHGVTGSATLDETPDGGAGSVPTPVLQVRNSFLVFETSDGIAIVDQHALHERILLERLHERVAAQGTTVQRLLVPEVLETGPADAARVAEVRDVLAEAGLLMEPFGEGAVAVHGVPAVLAGRPVRTLAEGVLQRLREGKGGGDLLHGVLETMACHAAVKAGDPLPSEMRRALLEAADGLATAGHCAHGRPTELRIGFEELERRFRRR